MSKERSSLAFILKLDAHARKFITVHSLDNGGQNIITKTFNILDSGPPQIPGGRNITEKSSRRLRTRQSQRKKIATACRKKKDCPLKNNCLTSSVIYNANVRTESDAAGMNYIGLTEGTFKQRYTQYKLSFRNRNYSKSTELSKHIWTLKDSNTNYKIDWSILATAPAYSNKRKRCHLCLTYQSINQSWRPQPSSTPGTPVLLVGHTDFQL